MIRGDEHLSAGSDPTGDDDDAGTVDREFEVALEPDPKTSEFDERRWDRDMPRSTGNALPSSAKRPRPSATRRKQSADQTDPDPRAELLMSASTRPRTATITLLNATGHRPWPITGRAGVVERPMTASMRRRTATRRRLNATYQAASERRTLDRASSCR